MTKKIENSFWIWNFVNLQEKVDIKKRRKNNNFFFVKKSSTKLHGNYGKFYLEFHSGRFDGGSQGISEWQFSIQRAKFHFFQEVCYLIEKVEKF